LLVKGEIGVIIRAMTKFTKWILLGAYGIVMLLVGVAIGMSPESPEVIDAVQSPVTSDLSLAPLSPSPGEGLAISHTPGVWETGTVKRVIDGDTIELDDGRKVRYIGIDTPETVDPRKPVQCFGAEASKKNKELVEGKEIKMEKDITDTDRYGRLLRYVYLGDEMVNIKMVRDGFAYSYTYPPDVKHQDQILSAQREAETGKAGLWTACPPKDSASSSDTKSAPYDAPAPAIAPAYYPEDTACAIKGNINSKGEKIYHMPGCGSYSQTVIDESKGEKMFCSESEAVSSGFRRALNCP
jgi:micrococcal nuclease